MNCKILFFCLLFIVPFQLLAQPAILQQRAYGAPEGCIFVDMKLTYDKGLLLGARSNSKKGIDKSENSDATDCWIVKLDSMGNKQWDKTLGGPGSQNLTCLSPTRDHGYIIGAENYVNVNGPDYWIVKLDSAGNQQWEKSIGGYGSDVLRSLDTTSDGGYILGGWSNSNISGQKTANAVGFYDYWIVKLDANGNIQWDKTIGGNFDDILTTVKQTKDHGYIVGGYSGSGASGDKSENNRGSYNDYWIVKVDAAGNKQWDKTIGGNGQDVLSAVIQTSDNSYIAGGWSLSGRSGDKTQPSKGENDYWLVLLDSNGHIQHDLVVGGNKADLLTSMQQTKDGGLILAGISYSDVSGDKTDPLAAHPFYIQGDYWVVKLDKKGRIVWDKDLGGKEEDQCYGVCEYQQNVYVVGGSSASGISGNRTKPLKGSADMWIVLLRYKKALSAFNTITSVAGKQDNTITHQLIIYPNPAGNIINIQSSGKNIFNLTNQEGKRMLSKAINGSGQINVSNLPSGIYYLQNTVTGGQQKVLIEH